MQRILLAALLATSSMLLAEDSKALPGKQTLPEITSITLNPIVEKAEVECQCSFAMVTVTPAMGISKFPTTTSKIIALFVLEPEPTAGGVCRMPTPDSQAKLFATRLK